MERLLALTVLLLTLFSCSHTQPVPAATEKHDTAAIRYTPVSKELYDEIRQQDSALFAAFNAHDSHRLMEHFSADLEFYHDKGGLTGYTQTALNFEQLFARNTTTGLHRDIVPGSLEVYPIDQYGAVETCLHRFCHEENGRQDCGTFKNTMIWKKTGEGWRVTRVISYDH